MVCLLSVVIACSPGPFLQNPLRGGLIFAEEGPFSPGFPFLFFQKKGTPGKAFRRVLLQVMVR
jgi:hypothetical protein